MEAELENEPTVEQEKAVTPLAEALQKINAREDADETEVEEVEEVVEEQMPETDAAPAKVEGPNLALKAVARQQGLHERTIALAKNDEELDILMQEFAESHRKVEKEPEPVKAPEFKIDLPEDEFPADDPVRKQLVAMHDHYSKQLDEAYGYLGQLADVALESKKALEQASESQLFDEQGQFDSFIDSLGVAPLGNRSQGEMPSMAQAIRQAIYYRFKDLESENPTKSRQSLLEQVAEEAGYRTATQKKKAGMEADNAKRLGGGKIKPLPEPTASGRDHFRKVLAEINSRPHNKEL